MIASPKVSDFLTPGSHGTTMGGNPLAMSSGLASYKQISKKSFMSKVVKSGDFFLSELVKMSGNKLVKEVRGLGLILAIEFYSSIKAKNFSDICLRLGLLVILTEKKNIRILPPLNVKLNEIKKSISIFNIALRELNE